VEGNSFDHHVNIQLETEERGRDKVEQEQGQDLVDRIIGRTDGAISEDCFTEGDCK